MTSRALHDTCCYRKVEYNPILLINKEAESQLFNHLDDYVSHGMVGT
jgi:hypothetical protein